MGNKFCPECGDPVLGSKCDCGWSLKPSNRGKDNRPPNHHCSANGCPLPGSITESTRSNDSRDVKWYCRFHYFGDPKSWDDITRDLQQNHKPQRDWRDLLIEERMGKRMKNES